MVRELPIRVRPLDDEPIESWLETYAARLNIRVATLTTAIGLRSRTWLWATGITAAERRAIQTATGVDDQTLTAMTLTRYVGHIPQLDASDLKFTGWMERALRGFRWCPDCLTDTGGRWKLCWRLPWSIVCTTHQRVLRYRYEDCGWSWQQIADEAGCSKHTAIDIGSEAGITSMAPGRRCTIAIDPDWLRTEYIDKRRTVPDIAAELDISPQRVRDKAREFGITLRARGGASHTTALRPAVGAEICPEPYRAAFQGQGAIERVRRFVTLVEQPTLTRAAQALGTTQTVLTSQLARLEANIGHQLVKRAQPHRPCELTPAGRDFLHHVRRILKALDENPKTATG